MGRLNKQAKLRARKPAIEVFLPLLRKKANAEKLSFLACQKGFFFMKKGLMYWFCLFLLMGCGKQEIRTNNEKRFVITSPELAETIAYLDGTERIFGVTSECLYPNELQSITKVGTFGKIEIEKVLQLQPTHIFTSGLEQNQLTHDLRKLSLPVYQIFINSYSDYPNIIKEIGKLIEKEKEANESAISLEQKISSLKQHEFSSKPLVYAEIYGSPIMTVSDSSLVGELINLAGGINAFPILPRVYSRIKAEEVVKANPDIILILYPDVTADMIQQRKGWQNIKAVKQNRIYTLETLNADLLLQATPRSIEGIEKLLRLFHEK
jgi:ABC-type Fe3+-hydroxamate transport system substrate-binding protein